MKFIVDSSALNKALKQIAPAVQPNPIIPALENILVKVDKGSLELTATNFNLTIIQKLNCESVDSFSMMLPFKHIMNISSVMREPITIENNAQIEIKVSGKPKYKLGKVDDIKNFPTIEKFEPIFEMDADEDFLYYLQLSIFCTSKEVSPYGFEHVSVEFKNDCVNIISTDAMQLFSYKKLIKQPTTKILIDKSFIGATKIIKEGKLSGNDKFFKVENDTTQIIGKLSETKYPDCSQFFTPDEYNCKVDRADLMGAINEMMVFNSILYHCVFYFPPNKIVVKFDDNDYDHHFETEIPATHNVEIEKIAFVGSLLKNLLSLITESEELNLSFTTKNALVHIDPQDSDLKLLIIPIMQ